MRLLLVRASITVCLGVWRLASSTIGPVILLLEATSLTISFVGCMTAGRGAVGEVSTTAVSSMTTSESGVSDLSRDSPSPRLYSGLDKST